MKLIKNSLPILFLLLIFEFLLFTSGGFGQGDRYFSRLQKYYSLGNSGQWVEADKLAASLDPR